MALQPVGPLVDTVLRRVRDVQGSAHPRALVRWLLSMAQQLVNARFDNALDTATFTTEPQRQIYPLAAGFPTSVRVIAVRQDGRDLGAVPWADLIQLDRRWHRRAGPRLETWSPIGRDLLVLHPALATAATVDVVVTKLTTSLTIDSDTLEVPDQLIPPMLDLVEAIVLTKGRLFEPAAAALDRLAASTQSAARQNV